MPSLYVYRLRMGEHEQAGVAGCFSVDEYERDVILKHERTRKDKEDDRTRHILELRAQTGPVFLTYRRRRRGQCDRCARDRGPPALRLSPRRTASCTRSGGPTAADRDALVAAFDAIPALYIADGHHRAASAMRARAGAPRRGRGRPHRGRHVSRGGIPGRPDPGPAVPPCREGPGRAHAGSRSWRRSRGRRRGSATAPTRRTARARWRCTWRPVVRRRPALAGIRRHAPADGLDVQLLQRSGAGAAAGIGDPRTDKRIDFVGGIRGPGALERGSTPGRPRSAFAMTRSASADLMAIADSGGIMPPKSTWFEPKLRDGLLTHLI